MLTSASLSAMPTAAESGVSINEVCPKNTTYAAPDGGLYDWIELYNASSSTEDISGWGLSDKSTKPYRYTFPSGTVIAPGQRLVIFCDSTAGASDNSIAPFGLSTSGETLTLTDSSGATVSQITFGAMASDKSYGQYPDGSGEFYTLSCTPDSANSAPEGANAVRTPEFSQDSGFYTSGFSLTLTAPEGTTVYYTTDGSDPTPESTPYTSPITVRDMSDTENVLSARTDISASSVSAPTEKVDKAAIVRAVAVDPEGRVSDIITKTYFIGKTASSYYQDMKVVSIVTDPDNLFDYETGIYVKGKVYDDENGSSSGGGWGWGWGNMKNPWEMEANYTQKGREWEREATLEMFNNGTRVISQNVGIRIKGAASRSAAQKSFNVYARKDYGTAEFTYDLYEGTATKAKNGKVIDTFDAFTLRNGGNDNGYAYFRDSINQQLVADRDFASQAASECVVFIDGEFWGMYQITERVSDDYIKSHYGIKKSDVVIIKNKQLEEGTDQDLADWNDLTSFCASSDMSSESNYARFTQAVDVQSYIDYFAAQIYWNNTDWPENNFAVWRSASVDEDNDYADGKWRMFMFDTEYATCLYDDNRTQASSDSFSRISQNTDDVSRMFTNLMNNEQFREQFELTFMDLANYNFDSAKADRIINEFTSTYSRQALDTYKRFNSSSYNMYGSDNFAAELAKVSSYYSSRYSTAAQQLRSALSLGGELKTVTVENDGSKGSISLNTLNLDDSLSSWSGKYYSDYKVTVTAVPKSGAYFSHWEVNGAQLTQEELYSPTVSIELGSDVTVRAIYGEGLLKGDYNADGTVNVSDLVLLQEFVLGKNVTIADTDMIDDGKTNSLDIAALRRSILSK